MTPYERAMVLTFAGALIISVVMIGVDMTRDYLLGRAFKLHMGSRESAWKVLDASNEHTDSLVKRGMRTLTAEEIDELLRPKDNFIRPHEFNVVDRVSGQMTRWEK